MKFDTPGGIGVESDYVRRLRWGFFGHKVGDGESPGFCGLPAAAVDVG